MYEDISSFDERLLSFDKSTNQNRVIIEKTDKGNLGLNKGLAGFQDDRDDIKKSKIIPEHIYLRNLKTILRKEINFKALKRLGNDRALRKLLNRKNCAYILFALTSKVLDSKFTDSEDSKKFAKIWKILIYNIRTKETLYNNRSYERVNENLDQPFFKYFLFSFKNYSFKNLKFIEKYYDKISEIKEFIKIYDDNKEHFDNLFLEVENQYFNENELCMKNKATLYMLTKLCEEKNIKNMSDETFENYFK